MPANDSYEFDVPPGYVKPTHEYGTPFGDEFHAEAVQELMLSMAGYTQRGVMLAPGQGALPTGTILGKVTATGLYYAYDGTATDGRQVALGVLRDARDTGGLGYTIAAYNTAFGTALVAGHVAAFPPSPSGKAPAGQLGNLVYKGVLNANLVSGTDTGTIVSGTGGGVVAATLTAMGARVAPFGGSIGANAPFPGGPMDGQTASSGVNAFLF
jgi:Bacteriophage lambda head decoration protein D